MTDRSRVKMGAYKSNYAGISRRDILRATAIIPASFIIPGWLPANAQTTTTKFDYYISTNGSDSNPGTLASPWAVTSMSLTAHNSNNVANCRLQAGKRIGFLPGTYDVSGIMYNDPVSGALQIIGGSSSASTYWGSSDSSGNYSPRTATFDAKGSRGIFGGNHSTGPGVWDGPIVAHIGKYPATYAIGYAILDGLRFTGFSYKGVRIGDGSYEGGGVDLITNPVLITNCEFFGGGFNAGDSVDNCAALWIDANNHAVTANNNYFHDTVGHTAGSGDHLNAIIVWGFGAICTGTMIEFNTCVNAGNIYGKEGGVSGTTIQNNYIDTSMFTAAAGVQDFTGNGQGVSGLTATTTIQNNICIVNGGGTAAFESFGGISTLSLIDVGWMTPIIVRNNTVINTSGSGALVGFTQVNASSSGVGQARYYNNIYVDHGSGGSLNGWGNYRTNPQALALSDYNLNPASGVTWILTQNASLGGAIGSYTSYSAFAAGLASHGGISGVEAHSLTGVPKFTGTGSFAAQYQLASGSAGKGAGSTTGVSGGAATDMGAWGNGATQVGCNFTSGAVKTPDSPALTVT